MNYFDLFIFIAKTVGIKVIITNIIILIINTYSQLNKLSQKNNNDVYQDINIEDDIISENKSNNEKLLSDLSENDEEDNKIIDIQLNMIEQDDMKWSKPLKYKIYNRFNKIEHVESWSEIYIDLIKLFYNKENIKEILENKKYRLYTKDEIETTLGNNYKYLQEYDLYYKRSNSYNILKICYEISLLHDCFLEIIYIDKNLKYFNVY